MAAIENRLDSVHVSMPGRVVSYDPATQSANVQPCVSQSRYSESGEREARPLPVLPSIPVRHVGGGGFRTTVPIKPGDTGTLVFCSCSIEQWVCGDGRPVDPNDDRRHTLSDAYFEPGVRVFRSPWKRADPDSMTVGHDTGPGLVTITESEVRAGGTGALATKADLDALVEWIHNHMVVATPAGNSTPGTTTTPPAATGTTVLKAG